METPHFIKKYRSREREKANEEEKEEYATEKKNTTLFSTTISNSRPCCWVCVFRREGFTSNTREEEVGCVGFLFHAFKRENE
jgi:hypothetical protein